MKLKDIFMRAKHFFIITLVITCQAAFGQDTKINLSVIDVDFETILEEICNQTGYTYRVNNIKLSKKQKFFINAKNISVKEVLKQCLEGTKLNYIFREKKITIFEGEPVDGAPPPVFAQTIKGTVRDIESKEILAGATVIALNTSPLKGCNSGDDGSYAIENVPLGRYSLKVSFVGYRDLVIPEIEVGSAKEVVVDIKLTELIHEIQEVNVEADKERPLNDMALVGSRSFSVEETKRYPTGLSDPARMVLCYAGVATSDDYMNEIIIRGNSPQYMLWRIEGVEVPSPNHFTDGGLTGGAISMLSSNVIGRSDFLTGAFPADYGNALSGVFDIFLRRGNNETTEFAAQIGTMGLDFSAEGPLKKGYNGSYLFNYRYSTLAFLNLLQLDFIGDEAPNYQDLSFKINLPTKKTGNFSFWGVGGASYDGYDDETDSTEWHPNEIKYYEKWADYMMALGVSHHAFLSNTSYIKSTIALTKYGTATSVDTLGSDDEFNNVMRRKMYNTAYRFTSTYNNKLSKRISFRTGASFNYSFYDYYFKTIIDLEEEYALLNSEGETFLGNVYAQFKFKIGNNMTLNTGANFLYYDLNKFYSFEPRCAIRWNLTPKQTLSFGYGVHSRQEQPFLYFKNFYYPDYDMIQLDLTPELPRSHHFIGSYKNRFTNNFYLKLEAYYQDLRNYYVASDPNFTFSAADSYLDFSIPLASSGKGRNYGVELTLEKYFTNDYYFLLTSSVFKSEYMALNKVWYSSIYDLGHINNFVIGKEFRFSKDKKRVLGCNFRVNWTGGKRDTPIQLQQSVESGFSIYDELKRNKIQYPNYFRIDLSLNYRLNKRKVAHIFSLDIQNITNRKNISYKYYDRELKSLDIENQAGLIPIFNYRIEF